jgi:hypothetical protein
MPHCPSQTPCRAALPLHTTAHDAPPCTLRARTPPGDVMLLPTHLRACAPDGSSLPAPAPPVAAAGADTGAGGSPVGRPGRRGAGRGRLLAAGPRVLVRACMRAHVCVRACVCVSHARACGRARSHGVHATPHVRHQQLLLPITTQHTRAHAPAHPPHHAPPAGTETRGRGWSPGSRFAVAAAPPLVRSPVSTHTAQPTWLGATRRPSWWRCVRARGVLCRRRWWLCWVPVHQALAGALQQITHVLHNHLRDGHTRHTPSRSRKQACLSGAAAG